MKKYIFILFSLFAASVYFFFSFWEPSGTIDRSIMIPVGVSRLSEPEIATHSLPSNPSTPTSDSKDIAVSTQSMDDQYMSAAFDYSLGDARLIGEAGVMGSDEILTINPIEEGQLPPLNQGMVNVTGDNAGYRMLPDGMTFKDDIQIVLPYDSTLLPMGFTPNDIKTYYFDIKYGRWIEIERDSVDENNQLVISKVNHFTDFINAVLKTPEMPETSAYAPTQMNDIKAANPLEGLQLMQPPTANNSGSVSMSYPIEIPAGRQGMQPSLALNYNGTTASSWVGVGWDLSIPAITVETRWGVPRYDHTKESELYLLNGQQLVTKDAEGNIEKMPHRTNQWKLRADNPTETQFFPRVNETFDSIVRHGTNPTNYWWSVTDRNGITSYYGKKHDEDAVDTNAVLRDGKGNIAHWGLTETRDIDGNTVRYYYSLVYHSGLLNNNTASLGQEIYIDSINYTGYVDAANNYQRGIYSVEFYASHDRDDITINGNYGFKRVDSRFLCHITVLAQSDILKSYYFSYSTANRKTNFKNLLLDIYRIDGYSRKLNCFIDRDLDDRDSLYFTDFPWEYTRTKFDYFLVPETDSLFGEQETITGYDDDISSFFITNPLSLGDIDQATALGATRGKSWGAGGTATVGGGPVVVLSSISAGGNFNYGRSKSEGALTLIDLDGDGLADKVYKKDGKVYFRKHVVSESGQHYFSSIEVELQGIDNFLLDVGENNAWGLQASALVNYAGSWSNSKSSTTTYFSDVNADGLPDLITDKGVWFNTLENGVPTFRNFIKEQHEDPEYQGDPNVIVTSGSGPCDGIIFDGAVNDSIACVVDLEFDTIIKTSVANYPLEDFYNDYGDPTQYYYYFTYFVENSGFTAYIYKKTIRCEPVLLEPNIDAVRSWIAPKDGIIKLVSNFQLIEDTTVSRFHSKSVNGVRYSIELRNMLAELNNGLNITNVNSGNASFIVPDSLVHARMVDKSDYVQKLDTFYLPVAKYSVLFFRLQSNGNRDFDKVSWVQDIQYQYQDTLDFNPIEDHFNSKNDFLVTGIHSVQVPEDGYVSGEIEITCGNLNDKEFRLYVASGPDLLHDTLIPTIHLTSNYNSTIFISYLPLNQYDKVNFYVSSPQVDKNDTLWKEIRIIPTLYFVPSSNNTITDSCMTLHPIVNYLPINHVENGLLPKICYENFGPMYRQWGQFGYHNNDTNQISSLIHFDTLNTHFSFFQTDTTDIHNSIYTNPSISEDMEYGDASANFENHGMYNPISNSNRWIKMIPNSKHQAWIGYGNITYITQDMISNTRIEEFFTTHETSDIPVYDHPVPNSYSTLYGPKTIRKINESKSKSRSTGAAVGIISLGYSTTKSTNKVVTDYMDLNGDRYPDFLGDIRVQYSMPWGGIGDELRWIDPELQVLTLSESNSSGQNFGASYPIEARMPSNDPKNSKITVNGSGSPSINAGNGTDNTITTWMDVNADGLPDKVTKDGRVALNLGYSFTPFEQWNFSSIREGENKSIGASCGVSFDVAQGSIGGGLGLGISENNSKNMLVDFNGDGLPDFVRRENGNLIVKYNLGNGSFSSPETIQGINHLSYGISYNESLNLSFTVGFTFLGAFKFGIGVSGSPYDKSFSKDSVQWVDVDGDGYVDYVTSDDENSIYVRYNQIGKANLLKQVTNFTGSTIALDYEMPLSSYESPQRSWVLKSVKTNDPYSPIAGNTTYTTFEYKNPNYNRFERISYGYDTVITYQHNPENNNAVYRKTIQGYNNKSFIKKGRKTSETICDAAGKMYVETFYDVTITDANGIPLDDSECPDLYFPNRECEVTNYYEGMATPQITTKKCVIYDEKKNVVEYINLVDSANNVVNDNLRAEISYKTGMPNNLISLVESITVYNSNDEVVREKSAEYSPNGKLIKIIQYNETDQAEIELNYDQYGNITQITFPENAWQEKMWNKYVYDPVVHTYPITVSNALGYQSSAQYDYKWGKPIKTFDINGQEMRYEYDYIGRLTKIIGPNEIASNAPFTLKMEYYPANYGRWSINTPHVETSPHPIDTFSYAVTYHYDVSDTLNPMKTTLLCDGLGRVIQTKKDIDIGGTELSVVSGKVVLDPYGRTIKQYHPVTEELTKYYKYNYSFDQNTVTTTQYDLLDREIKVTLPNNTQTHMQYGFGNDAFGIKRFLTTTIDPLGNKLKTYTDPRKLQTTSIVDSTIVTNFAYNSLGELIRSTDPDDHPTSYSYNKFGQQISRTHPDAGTDHFTYDLAGNLISRQTQDLNNNNLTIDYLYKFNQLIEVHYPKNPENNVYYFYGDNTATNNRKGRVYAIEDASGRQEFSYGMMGEVIENIRTFALPNDPNTYTFAMGFEYDSWNRILSTTYPDGEHVLYEYNRGGQFSKMSSNYNNEVYHYVDSINYNKFEQRTAIYYGNGTRAEYQYDILQRLTHLKSISNNGVMQEIDYTFDAVNNITGISNVAGVLNNGLGGTYNHNYSYDNSYRLISSNGLWDNNNNSLDYQLSLTYTMDGRIKTKTQSATTLIGGALSNFSYNNHYTYYDNQPHILKDVIDPANYQHFEWDANGNLTFHVHELNGTQRKLCWDEENRLMAVGDNNYTSYYIYDNSGERTYKLTGKNTMMNINGRWVNFATMDNPTLYTSAYLVAGLQGYTKHYYAGSERVSSAIGLGGLGNINDPLPIEFGGSWDEKSGSLMEEMNRTIVECLKNEYKIEASLKFLHDMKEAAAGTMDCYFYHPDHLGSSSWITDGSGNAIQHLHYLPFGEDWVDQRTTSWNAPYTFSGKEKDVETGYGYFGARYYDSGLSIWLSVDPMSDKYPSLSPYNYCANNPVILVDPDGRDWYESEDGSVLSYIHGKIDEMEGYKHIGTTLGQEQKDAFNRGDYSTLNISANFKEDDFVTQMGSDGKSKMSCAAAANAMCIQRGGDRTSYANEFPMVTEGANGRAGDGIQSNLFSAIVDVSNSLLQGIPVVGGVDYKNDSPNKKTSGGDGMTDHYIAITGVSLSLSKGDGGQVKITGGSFQYANPGNFSFVQGLSSKNILNFNSNGWKASNSKYILTTMRVK